MAVPPIVKLTASDDAVLPLRVIVNWPVLEGSPAFGSVAEIDTVGVLLTLIPTLAELLLSFVSETVLL